MNIYCIQCCFRKPTLVLLSLALVTCMILILKQYLNNDSYHSSNLKRRNTSNDEYGSSSNAENNLIKEDLLLRIEDLRRIKVSVRNELRSMEREKNKLLKEKATLMSKNDKLVTQIGKSKVQLKQLELDISANRKQKFEKNCDIESISPVIYNPMKSIDLQTPSWRKEPLLYHHNQSNQMDFSHCSLAKKFKFHVLNRYDPSLQYENTTSSLEYAIAIDILTSHRQHTADINSACILLHVFDGTNMIEYPKNKNILVIASSLSDINFEIPGNVALASSIFNKSTYRSDYDIVLPSIWQSPESFTTIIGSMPPYSPIERKYLASYFGQSLTNDEEKNYLDFLESTLRNVHRNSIDDLFLFSYDCGQNPDIRCYEEKDKIIDVSTFLVILATSNNPIDSNANNLLYLALSKGAIPVIIGKERTKLPFSEVIDWSRCSVLLHSARLPELHFILRSFDPADLYLMKYHGRRVFEMYLVTMKQILTTTISLISVNRFGYPPEPIEDINTISHYDQAGVQQNFDYECKTSECQETKTDSINSLLMNEILGPREKPFPSKIFRRNFSLVLNSGYELWNNPIYNPHRLHPNYPIDPIPPSDYKFYSMNNYRPIAEGLGGSGVEFSKSLGGDYPNEQFTIVLLTYDRNSLLMKTLERLKGLAYLNKILVVWNGIKHKPPQDLLWPDVGVPIVVVKVDRNSLNNRFLPYDAIETEAILSLDDDTPLRPDEIVFGFRVWREARDRIVGFPGRYHAWNENQNSWLYNSNHSCELSMVLTGGAFFHKYYTYIYTYDMSPVIHSIVDKFMNCEDIAMNFLVAHLTRKPPIKVTSRWTFHCTTCASSLSEEDSHFRERHECLNTFVSIYGYMPLLNTQHRSDSVLFKTKLPLDKQKCFKFV